MTNQFYETRTMFENFTGCTPNKRLPYDVWMTFHHPDKDGKDPNSKAAAALFVMFFDEIMIAWNNSKADFTPDEDGIDVVLQYLEKNVMKIRENKERYTPGYIYRVAYNCMDCLRYVEREKFRSRLESSNIVQTGDDTVDLYDLQPDEIDFDKELLKKAFWNEIEKLDDKSAKVINHLLSGVSLAKVSSRAASREDDELRDVRVTADEYKDIIANLQKRLLKYKSAFLGQDKDLVEATEEDLIPKNLRKTPKLGEQVYAYMKDNGGSINLFEAERFFLMTRMPLHSLMKSLIEAGHPVKAHWVEVDDKVVKNKTIDMIDYYYLEA